MIVGTKYSEDSDIFELPHVKKNIPWARICHKFDAWLANSNKKVRGISRLRYWLRTLAGGWPEIERALGREDFNFPGSSSLLDLLKINPDIIHCHNLHGNYFDLRMLPKLSHQFPVILTLHDVWLLTGHCAHSLDCDQWRLGCEKCPYLKIYPKIKRDSTSYNWRRKRRIYEKSQFFVATPSKWLMDKVKESILDQAILDYKVIPHGVDQSIFKLQEKKIARSKLNLPLNGSVLLTVGNEFRNNPWKDYPTIVKALGSLDERLPDHQILFLVVGQEAPPEQIGRNKICFIPYQNEQSDVATYYQAADIYIHAARAEVWGLTITEAMACGTPVIATAVGGIPEQINPLNSQNNSPKAEHGATGLLINEGDSKELASSIS
ncbi:glycosyltransferase, partial [candidate division CSSED10-310 bacterium]